MKMAFIGRALNAIDGTESLGRRPNFLQSQCLLWVCSWGPSEGPCLHAVGLFLGDLGGALSTLSGFVPGGPQRGPICTQWVCSWGPQWGPICTQWVCCLLTLVPGPHHGCGDLNSCAV